MGAGVDGYEWVSVVLMNHNWERVLMDMSGWV